MTLERKHREDMQRFPSTPNIFLILLLFLLMHSPESGAEQDSSRHDSASSGSNRRPRRKDHINRPYITFNMKSLVCLPLQRSKTLRIETRISSTSPVTYRWTTTNSAGLPHGDRLKITKGGLELLLKPPFTKTDSGTFNVMACNKVGCTAKGVRVIFYGDNSVETGIKTVAGRGAKILAWIGWSMAVFFLVSLVVTAVIMKRYWTRWIFMKKVKAEYRSQTTSLHGGNDPCSWLWAWRTASQAGFHKSDELEEGNEYEDPLRLDTKKTKKKHEKKKKHTGKKSSTPGQPSVFKQLHDQNRPLPLPPPLPPPRNDSAFQTRRQFYRGQSNGYESLADSFKGQTYRTDNSMDGQIKSGTNHSEGSTLSLSSESDIYESAEDMTGMLSGENGFTLKTTKEK